MYPRNVLSKVLVLTVAAVLILSGCGPSTPEVTQTQAPQIVKETVIVAGTPQVVEKVVTQIVGVEKVVTATAEPKPKVLTIGHHLEPTNLDPFDSTTAAYQSVTATTIENLLYFTPDGRDMKPGLAESWVWEEGGKTLVLKLRKGVKFHNGEDFTAEAAKLTVELLMTEPSYEGYVTSWESVEIVDDYTVAIHFTAPAAASLGVLARASFVYPPKYYQQVGKEGFGQAPIGTGPYQFVEWSIGNYIKFKAFPDYWGGTPKLDEIVWRPIPEAAARIAALQTGEVDLIINLTAGSRAEIESNPDLALISQPGLRMFATFFDLRVDHPIKDKTVRRALNYAVDKDGLVALYDGNAVPLRGQYLTEAIPGFNPDVDPFEYDPEKALALLAEAGYPDGFELDLKYTTDRFPLDRALGEAVASYLEAVGIKVTQIPLEYGEFSRQFREPSMGPVYQWGLLDAPDPWMTLSCFLSNSPRYARWPENQYVDGLINASEGETDPAKREALYRELMQYWNDEPIGIYLVAPNDIYGINRAVVGFVPNVMQVVELFDVDIVQE